MQSKKKSRVVLITSLSVSLFAVLSMSVSTFAWFQAAANATATATSTSTTITTNDPENQFQYYAYRGNLTPSHICGSTDIDGDGIYEFEDDFLAITSGNVAAQTNFESLGFYPGKSYTFCVKLNSLTASTSKFKFDTAKIISNDVIKEGKSALNRYVSGTNPYKKINVGWAINIHTYLINATTATPSGASGYTPFVANNPNSNSYVSSYPDKFAFTQSSTGTYASTLLEQTGTNNIIPVSVPLLNQTTAAATSAYIFYRINFSTRDDTLYKEVDDGGNYQIIPPDSGNRFFAKYSSGDKTQYTSNCYADLKFALTELSLTIS